MGADLEGTTQFKLFLDGEVNGVTEHGPRIKKKNIGGAPGFPVGRTASACLFSFFFFFFTTALGAGTGCFIKPRKMLMCLPRRSTPHARPTRWNGAGCFLRRRRRCLKCFLLRHAASLVTRRRADAPPAAAAGGGGGSDAGSEGGNRSPGHFTKQSHPILARFKFFLVLKIF